MAKELKALLLELKAAAEQARAAGQHYLPPPARSTFVARNQALGYAANPSPSRRARQWGWVKQTPAQNLLERLWLERQAVLASLDDLTIPFDSNQAERHPRMLKVQRKVSGAFRSMAGAEAFSRLRGCLSTLHKQGVPLLAGRETLFTGQPLYPSFA